MLSRNFARTALRCSFTVNKPVIFRVNGIRRYSSGPDPFDFKFSPEQAEKLQNNKFLQKLSNSPEALEAMVKTASLIQEKGINAESGKIGVMAQLKFMMDPEIRKQLVTCM